MDCWEPGKRLEWLSDSATATDWLEGNAAYKGTAQVVPEYAAEVLDNWEAFMAAGWSPRCSAEAAFRWIPRDLNGGADLLADLAWSSRRNVQLNHRLAGFSLYPQSLAYETMSTTAFGASPTRPWTFPRPRGR